MYFQCREMHCLEGFTFDPNFATLGPSARLRHASNAYRALPLSSDYWTLADFHTQLCTEYFGRRLSFPKDALNAFEGALDAFNAFEESDMKGYVGHIWGIPIFSSDGTLARRTESFLSGLMWFATNDGNTLMVKSSSTQNGPTIFPSWSWAASKARQLPDHSYFLSMNRWWEEATLHKGGATVLQFSPDIQQNFSPWIELTGWTRKGSVQLLSPLDRQPNKFSFLGSTAYLDDIPNLENGLEQTKTHGLFTRVSRTRKLKHQFGTKVLRDKYNSHTLRTKMDQQTMTRSHREDELVAIYVKGFTRRAHRGAFLEEQGYSIHLQGLLLKEVSSGKFVRAGIWEKEFYKDAWWLDSRTEIHSILKGDGMQEWDWRTVRIV
jgi:hypothetical protein